MLSLHGEAGHVLASDQSQLVTILQNWGVYLKQLLVGQLELRVPARVSSCGSSKAKGLLLDRSMATRSAMVCQPPRRLTRQGLEHSSTWLPHYRKIWSMTSAPVVITGRSSRL